MENLKKYLQEVDVNAAETCEISDAIWDFAELPFGEYKSAELLTDRLAKHGFNVTAGVAGMPTAFTASYGSGRPVIGILAEYDALDGLSQEAGVAEPKPIPGVTSGHGCGHNLFAAGSFSAALAVKKCIEETGKGTVILFGCPAEENGGGKVFMARDGIFKGVDAIVSWHPAGMYMARTRPALATATYHYSFYGTASHAGAAPHRGRSALDALELMNVGINFLREHMLPTSRINTSILDTGGTAPNVIPAFAKGCFMIRAEDRDQVADLVDRVAKIAEGAALMTGTRAEGEFIKAYSNLITIPSLQQAVWESMQHIEFPQATEEELAFANALRATMNLSKAQLSEPPYATEPLAPVPPVPHGGSTDTADVSWNCPTVQIHGGVTIVGTPGHSWQSVAQGKCSYAKKGTLYVSKVLALTAMRLIFDEELLARATAEHKAKIGDGYKCPIPADVKPLLRPEEA